MCFSFLRLPFHRCFSSPSQTKYVIVNFEGRIDAARMQHADYTVSGKKKKVRGWQSVYDVARKLRVLRDDTLRLPQAKKGEAIPSKRLSIHSIVCAQKSTAGLMKKRRQDTAAAEAASKNASDDKPNISMEQTNDGKPLSKPADNNSRRWDWLQRPGGRNYQPTSIHGQQTVLSFRLLSLAQRHVRPLTYLLLLLILPLLADLPPLLYTIVRLCWTLHPETIGLLFLLLLLLGWAATRFVVDAVQKRVVSTEGNQTDRAADRNGRRRWEDLPASLGLPHTKTKTEEAGDQHGGSSSAQISEWLQAHGVDTSKFGQSNRHSLDSLREELASGECTLVCPDRLQASQANRRFQRTGAKATGVATTAGVGPGAIGDDSEQKMKVIQDIRIAKVEIVRERVLVKGQHVQLIPSEKGESAHSDITILTIRLLE